MVNALDFMRTFEKYYFRDDYKQNNLLGIKGIKTTLRIDEENIVKKLKDGIHDQDVIAWKMGG